MRVIIATNDKVNMRYEVLRKITSTISDSAATEVSFKELLLAYRSDLMKGYIDNFDRMTPGEHAIIIYNMNRDFYLDVYTILSRI